MTDEAENLFVELDFCQRMKSGENICGDAFVSQRIENENRVISVLSDGLGSGVKANILASMTASMAIKFASGNVDFMRSAEIMMKALPICSVRKISYATFTIVDIVTDGNAAVIENGNPEFLFFHNSENVAVPFKEITSPEWNNRAIRFSNIRLKHDDRIVFFSDGICQAGMGTEENALGWRVQGCRDFISAEISRKPSISSRELAMNIVSEALSKERDYKAGDDITCAVIHLRHPRKMLLITGPPFLKEKDKDWAFQVDAFKGDKVICGGTTANIIARELDREINMDLSQREGNLPPISEMENFDLITEGIFTLTRIAQYLEGDSGQLSSHDPAGRIVEILRRNDIIEFLVGTRINEAHQDPNLPVDIEIRRTIIRRIERALKTRFLKQTKIRFV